MDFMVNTTKGYCWLYMLVTMLKAMTNSEQLTTSWCLTCGNQE